MKNQPRGPMLQVTTEASGAGYDEMSGRCKADAEQGRREACPNAGEKRFTLTQPEVRPKGVTSKGVRCSDVLEGSFDQ